MIKIQRIVVMLAVLTLGLSAARANNPDYRRLNERIQKALVIVKELRAEKGIPQSVIDNARGIAVLRITKGGLVVSGSNGHGLVVARTATGWSAPLAFSAGGAGLGLQIGTEESDIVFILNSQEAVDDFMRGSAFKLGANATATGGSSTVREGASLNKGVVAYRRTNGAFAGVAFDGADVTLDNDTNRNAYGDHYSPSDVLSGKVAAPAAAMPLYRALGR